MDVAYDHIQEEALPAEPTPDAAAAGQEQKRTVNDEFQEAFKAVSASPWGAKLGGIWGQLRTQGETLYSEAAREVETASKGLTELRTNIAQRARAISIPQPPSEEAGAAASFSDPNFVLPEGSAQKGKERAEGGGQGPKPVENLPADIVKEATSMVARFRSEAATRLESVRKAEDAADEALLRFGTNVRNFLRDAVTVSGPDGDEAGSKGDVKTEVLFETNDAEGRRVFHSSRFDAQLHAIHTRAESFSKDPEGGEWDKWKKEFDVGKETDRIAADLDRFEELRRAMEKLVPETVVYKDFWTRYYFLRMVVDEEERRRKEVLKGAAADNEEEVGWGDDDDDDESTTPVIGSTGRPGSSSKASSTLTNQSTTTLTPAKQEGTTDEPKAPRQSHEEDKKSNSADSDASYDVVSGATSMGPGTPMMSGQKGRGSKDKEESDDEDWE